MNRELVYKVWDKIDVDYMIHSIAKQTVRGLHEVISNLPALDNGSDETRTVEASMEIGRTLKDMYIEDFIKMYDEALAKVEPILKRNSQESGA